MITAEQETALRSAEFWLKMAQETNAQGLHIWAEAHTQRAIKNLMVASHGR